MAQPKAKPKAAPGSRVPAVELATVTIQAVAAKGFFSWVIETAGYGAHGWSHIDIVLPDGRLLGARTDYPVNGKTGVQIRPAGYGANEWKRRRRVSFKVPAARAADAYAFAEAQTGDPYARDDIWAIATGQPDDPQGRWICSMLAGAFLLKAGAIDDPGMPMSQMNPNCLVACGCSAGGAYEDLPV